MKRYLLIILLCLLSIEIYSQHRDNLKNIINQKTSTKIINKVSGINSIICPEYTNFTTVVDTTYLYLDTINQFYCRFKRYFQKEGYLYISKHTAKYQLACDTLYNIFNIPTCIYDRYQLGERLMIGGWINFGVGLTLAAIGGIFLVTTEKPTLRQLNAGHALCGIGGALVSISIPLLCFGDNAKREANVDYELFNLVYKE